MDCVQKVFFGQKNIKFLFRKTHLNDTGDVKTWLLDYFTNLVSNRAKSLVTEYLTPPLRYAAIVSGNELERQQAYQQCMEDWQTLLAVESAVAGGATCPMLDQCHWRLSALNRVVAQPMMARLFLLELVPSQPFPFV